AVRSRNGPPEPRRDQDVGESPACLHSTAPENRTGPRSDHRLCKFPPSTNRRRSSMSSADSLKDVYIEELRDLWSANDQMQRVMQSLSEKASDSKLKEMLAQSVGGIGRHTATLKSILEAQGGNVGKDHCKGMEGLVAEAKKHAIEAEVEGQ